MFNWKYNPRSGVYNPESISGEIHTIAYDPDVQAYVIRLNQSPQKTTPSNVSISESGTGGGDFTEISSRTPPNVGEFWVDYEADGFDGTGIIEFNPADNGKTVEVSYNGLGNIIKDTTTGIVVVYQRTLAGTGGGGNASVTTWHKRELNLLNDDAGYGFCSLDTVNDEFTLSAGKYLIEWSCPASGVNGHLTRIRQDGNIIAYGSAEFAGGQTITRSTGATQVDVSGSSTFYIEHYTEDGEPDGLGYDLAPAGTFNIYTLVKITNLDLAA